MKQSNLIISTALEGQQFDLEDGVDILQESEHELRQLYATTAHHGERLDKVLASLLPEFSRSYLQQLIELKLVTWNGAPIVKPAFKVKAGDRGDITLIPTLQSQAFKAEKMALDVIFEDAHLLIINKPAGLVVHPAPGNWSGTLLNGLLAHHATANLLPRAGIVHRLDKDTSGLMVVAKTRAVMDALVTQIAARTVKRQYLALAHKAWRGAKEREVNAPIGRDSRNRLRMAVVDLAINAGKTALTHINLLQNSDDACLVRCRLHTGRTHQIRVHMAAIGHPLIGDILYGGSSKAGIKRQALHAFNLAFLHPVSEQFMECHAPLPLDFLQTLTPLGLSYNFDHEK